MIVDPKITRQKQWARRKLFLATVVIPKDTEVLL